MLLTHPELARLIDEGMIDALKKDINASSIDVHLGDKFLVEARDPKWRGTVDINAGEAPVMQREGICYNKRTGEARESLTGTCHRPDRTSIEAATMADYTSHGIPRIYLSGLQLTNWRCTDV